MRCRGYEPAQAETKQEQGEADENYVAGADHSLILDELV